MSSFSSSIIFILQRLTARARTSRSALVTEYTCVCVLLLTSIKSQQQLENYTQQHVTVVLEFQ